MMGRNNITVLNDEQIASMRQTMLDQQRLIWALIKASGGTIKVDEYLFKAAGNPECKLTRSESVDKKSIVFGAT